MILKCSRQNETKKVEELSTNPDNYIIILKYLVNSK